MPKVGATENSTKNGVETVPMSDEDTQSVLVGKWSLQDGKIVGNDVCEQIQTLIREELDELARSADGWSILFIDNASSVHWELSYPNSGQHGGGPPMLTQVSFEKVKHKYQL